jgi:hypothetical protein
VSSWLSAPHGGNAIIGDRKEADGFFSLSFPLSFVRHLIEPVFLIVEVRSLHKCSASLSISALYAHELWDPLPTHEDTAGK